MADKNGVSPAPGPYPVREAGLAYLRTMRVTLDLLHAAPDAAAEPAPQEQDAAGMALDGLAPPPGPQWLLALMLSALRPDALTWLGPRTLRRAAASRALSEAALTRLLDDTPPSPPSLEDPLRWTGRRVPLAGPDGIGWLDLYWRADRAAGRAGIGAFAARLALPGVAAVELHGRLEEHRLDMVAETATRLPRTVAAKAEATFDLAMSRLGLAGTLTVRG